VTTVSVRRNFNEFNRVTGIFMIKSTRLESITELAVSKEKNAIQALGDFFRKKQDEEAKLDQLIAFRDQYANQLNQGSENSIAVNTLLSYRSFVAKLDRAIDEQRNKISEIETQLGSRRSAWNAARTHKMGMQKLLDVSRGKELQMQNKREQLEIDDRNSRIAPSGNGPKSA